MNYLKLQIMAKQEKITPQQALESIYGLMKLLEVEQLKKLIAAVGKIPNKIEAEAKLSEEHKNFLDKLMAQYQIIDCRFLVLSKLLISKRMWFLYLLLTAIVSVGITILATKNSTNEWAHRALIAAIDMNHENPIGEYLNCLSEMPQNRKHYKNTVKSMEYDAAKTLYLESILKDYINGDFSITKYDSRTEGHLIYLALCNYSGSNQQHVFKIHLDKGEVAKVEEYITNPKKRGKNDPEYVWKEITPAN